MADTSIGTARIDVVVDSEKAEATVKRMGRSVDGFSKSAQQQYNQLATAEKKRVDGLLEQARGLVLNKVRQAEFNSQLKLSGPLLDEFNRLLAQNAARAASASIAFGTLTAAAAAATVLLVAWKQGSDEATRFNEALIKTGGYAGITAREAQKLAEEMDNLAGVTNGSAMAALTAFANTGHFTGESLREAASAAAAWSEATGVAVEDTIAEFEEIRKDPVKALLELNSTYHFLTKAQLDHIAQLQDEGREAEAAAEATKVYAGVLRDRSQQIIGNLGALESSWRGLKNIAREAWDELLAVGREDTIASRIMQAAILASPVGSTYAQLQAAGRKGQGTPAQMVEAAMAENDRTLALVDSERAAKELANQRKAKEEATRTWLQLSQQNLDKKQKQLAEEKKITEAGRALGKTEAQINEELAKSRARFAESQKKSGRSKAAATDPTDAILSRIKQQIALNQQAAEGEGKVTAAQRMRVQVEEELARIGGKASAARRAEIEAGLKQVEVSEAAAEAAKSEANAKKELARLINQLAAAEQNRRAQNELDLLAIGRGGVELERMQRRLDIAREYEDGLKQLRDKGVAEDSESYRQQEQALRESRERMLADEDAYFARRTEMMADWHNGAQRAIDDYLAYVADAASRTQDYVSGIIGELSSGLADVISRTKSAKDAAGDFADFLFQQSAKMVADQFLGSVLGRFGLAGKDKDSASELNGAAAALASSAAPLSAAAAALAASAAALSAAGLGNAVAGGGSANNYGEAAGTLLDLFSGSGFGFDSGGWTGDAPTNKVTGVVHGKEFVVNAEATRRLGRGYLERLNLGQEAPTSGGQVLNQTVVMNVQGVMTQQTADQSARELGRETQYRMSRA